MAGCMETLEPCRSIELDALYTLQGAYPKPSSHSSHPYLLHKFYVFRVSFMPHTKLVTSNMYTGLPLKDATSITGSYSKIR